MLKSDKEKGYMAFLALVIIAATFYLAHTLLTSIVPKENADIVNVSFGLILGLSATVVNYYFGSSKSSSDKTPSGNQMGRDEYVSQFAEKTEETKKREIDG